MQLELQFHRQEKPSAEVLVLADQDRAQPVSEPSTTVPLHFIKNPRARRYILRVRPDGSVRVTIPRGGTKSFARDFAQGHAAWIQKQLQKQARRPKIPQAWNHGTEILFHGQPVQLIVAPGQRQIHFAGQVITLRELASDLKPAVQRHLRRLALKELALRTLELAASHQVPVRRVVVRNQRSRWGSCSAKGAISLNWRLIQTPASVRDYLIIHELMHFREMNHSSRFWNLVQKACPDYPEAEKWLNRHNHLLRSEY